MANQEAAPFFRLSHDHASPYRHRRCQLSGTGRTSIPREAPVKRHQNRPLILMTVGSSKVPILPKQIPAFSRLC